VPKGEPVRDLGIFFSSDLKWRSHIDITVKKARRTSFALLRSLRSKDPKFLVNMFKTYVLPILEFGSPIFNPYYSKDIDLMEKVQREFVRIVYKRSLTYRLDPNKLVPSYSDLLCLFNLELLELRRLKYSITIFHQYLHGLTPLTHNNSFQFLSSKTRGDSQKIVPSFSSKDVRFNSFFIQMARIFSKLPPNFITCSVINLPTLLKTFDFSPFLNYKER
jgi:hypothetical protein